MTTTLNTTTANTEIDDGLSATYSPEDNKLRLYATQKLDAEIFQKLKEAGFKYAPRQQLFVAPMWTPQREDLLLCLCGEIGDEQMTLSERAAQRAERFTQYGVNRAHDSQQAFTAYRAIADSIPFGQPILVGHHSERKSRKNIERMESHIAKSVKTWEQSEYWIDRAKSAQAHASYKSLPAVRIRRIAKLQAEQRKMQRIADAADKAIDTLANPSLTLKQALDFSAVSSLIRNLYSDLTKSPTEYLQICAKYIAPLECLKERHQRWVTHYKNRVTYEQAMLNNKTKLSNY